jgi:hypothetical protein
MLWLPGRSLDRWVADSAPSSWYSAVPVSMILWGVVSLSGGWVLLLLLLSVQGSPSHEGGPRWPETTQALTLGAGSEA